jgi:hypothetical protein
MTNRADADFLQVLCREAWQDLFGNLILAESGLISLKAEAPQPHCHIHDSAQRAPVAPMHHRPRVPTCLWSAGVSIANKMMG